MKHKSHSRAFTYRRHAEFISASSRLMQRGFTLIELLVVVLIIGILAAVAVPQYQKAVAKARATQVVMWVDSIQKAIDLYLLEQGVPTEDKKFLMCQDGLVTTNNLSELSLDIPDVAELCKSFYADIHILPVDKLAGIYTACQDCEKYGFDWAYERSLSTNNWSGECGGWDHGVAVCRFLKDTHGWSCYDGDNNTAC